jgi:uncharacterized membrane protein
LITAGWLMLRRNKPWIAGGAIGLAASLHAFPALLVLYFAVRSWRAFLSGVATIAAVSLAVAGLTSGRIFMKWLEVAGANSRQFVPKAGNLSVAGLIANFARGMNWPEHVDIVAPAAILIVAVALLLFLGPWNRRALCREQMDIEYSIFVTAMLLASPISWGRYLPIMLLPLAVLIRNLRLRRPAWAASGLLAVLFFISSSDSTSAAVSNWLALEMGFTAGWLVSALPSFSIMVVLLWLGLSADWANPLPIAENKPGLATAHPESL